MYHRSDVVIVSAKGDGGKPRPAVVVQANWFNFGNPPSYIICLLSSEIHQELDFRPIISPSITNGLKIESQVMTDKVQAVRSINISKKIGILDSKSMQHIDNNLRSLLNL